jgi:hypothetical protein
MSTANATQVGGTHYKNPFQHWDLCHELDLGYFEGQISKYITRHRFKKGKEDAEKALHFCQKLIELASTGGRMPRHKMVSFARMSQYAEANNLLPIEYACINSVCNWQFAEDLTMLQARIERLISETYPSPALDKQDRVWNKLGGLYDTGGPGPGYVDQGRDI